MGKRQQRRKLGEILVSEFGSEPGTIEGALAEQGHRKGLRLGEILVERGSTSEEVVARALALQLSIPFYDLSKLDIPSSIGHRLPEHIVLRHRAMPIGLEKDALLLAMADPLDVLALDDIAMMCGQRVKPAVVAPKDLEKAMNRFYAQKWREVTWEGPVDRDPTPVHREPFAGGIDGDTPIIRLCNLMLSTALSEGTPELRLQPDDEGFHLFRYEKDRLPLRQMTFNRSLYATLLGRFTLALGLETGPALVTRRSETQLTFDGVLMVLHAVLSTTGRGEALQIRFSPAAPPAPELGSI